MRLLAPLLLATLASAANAAPLADFVDPDWAGPIWDDGQAEVATYQSHRAIYGADRPHTSHLITVKEDLRMDLLVKADWPWGDATVRTVLKQNQVATIPTPNYPYHFMASLFVDRANVADAMKLSVSSQEWCGMTFKTLDLTQSPPVMHRSSYWDGEGTGRATVAAHVEGAHFEEELPLLARALRHEEGMQAELMLYPNQTTTRASVPVPSAATLSVARTTEEVSVPAGSVAAGEAWLVTVKAEDGRTITLVVADDEMDTLVAYDFGDGRKSALESVERRAYWVIEGE
jgi:hypothetical protein